MTVFSAAFAAEIRVPPASFSFIEPEESITSIILFTCPSGSAAAGRAGASKMSAPTNPTAASTTRTERTVDLGRLGICCTNSSFDIDELIGRTADLLSAVQCGSFSLPADAGHCVCVDGNAVGSWAR